MRYGCERGRMGFFWLGLGIFKLVCRLTCYTWFYISQGFF
nr:MAG TPA: hypothetical protein [Caudoviricetes sp.]